MNYRHSRYEIDLIASKPKMLIFVEVKTRTNISFGNPEAFVDDKKAENVMKAADHFIHEHNWKGDIRFDIISILKKDFMELEHIKDAFH
ncbi:UNVERIFIED_CONTAM: hypothetical protein GTU68_052387 [Idotea baltica]|nr:hypothetical protein [Idotea baltica]